MAAEIVVAVFISLFVLFLSHWYRNRNSLVTNWPIVGMIPGLLRNSWRIFDYFSFDVLRRCGGTFEFKGPLFPSLDFLLTSDPNNINHIMSKNFVNYEKGSEFREIFEPFGEGIFTLDSDRWKTQRKVMQTLMRNNKFTIFRDKVVWKKLEKGLIPIFEHAATLGTEVNLEDVFQRFDYDNMSLFALGFDPDSLNVEFPAIPSKEAFADIEEALLFRHFWPKMVWKFQNWLQIGEEKKLIEGTKILDQFVYNCISSRREKFSKNKELQAEEDEYDLLTSFLVEDQGESGAFEQSDKVIRDTAVNLMLAGIDSVSGGLSWFFWIVATNPSVEAKIVEEIKRNSSICKDKNMIYLSEEELNRFIYLHAVFCETLRLYPPIPANHKTVVQSDILPSGHRVQAGSRILISIYSMGRMEQIWGKDCLEFKPERWISEKGDIVYVPSYKYPAFNSGPRTCLGKDMSFLQMKTVAIALLKNYRVEMVQGHVVVPRESITLHMKNGLKVRIKKRHV
ncbi:alkane hydroxylase MAH1-like [Durio zibethinus]|uniref:Alkane hydroxylase MAH1-like n=1 Tax=Durio zibethinus TaxID=66656 RepID=A0A6P5YLK2_DURZI|nr:alkane hydroxylase MAH1-like [Durio zibethinus]